MRASECRWHHNSGKTVVEDIHPGLIGVPSFEIVEEAHSCANQDGETTNGNSWFGIKLEEGDQHRNSDTSTTNSSDCAQCHDESEDEEADDLKAFLRKNILVCTLSLDASEVWLLGTISIDFALVIVSSKSLSREAIINGCHWVISFINDLMSVHLNLLGHGLSGGVSHGTKTC